MTCIDKERWDQSWNEAPFYASCQTPVTVGVIIGFPKQLQPSHQPFNHNNQLHSSLADSGFRIALREELDGVV